MKYLESYAFSRRAQNSVTATAVVLFLLAVVKC